MKYISYNKNLIKIALHCLVWLIVFSLPYLLRSHYGNNKPDPNFKSFLFLNSLTDILWILLFYLNAIVLIPQLIYKKKFKIYGGLLAGIFSLIMAVHYMLFISLVRFPFNLKLSIGFNFPTFLLTVAASFTYKMLIDRAASEKLAYEKQEQNMKTEVSFLRSQISPHFIFNVLNNLVALIRLKSEELEPTVLKLSALMQYMLYETDEEKVPLKNEADYLQNYIDLQQQRFGSKVKMTVCIDVPEYHFNIEPMLLIPFVENAFKHGVGFIKDPQIDIKLYTKSNLLYFSVRNKYNGLVGEAKDKTSGIGLQNVTRRLSLLYPEKHNLLINKDEEFFNISLQITLTNA